MIFRTFTGAAAFAAIVLAVPAQAQPAAPDAARVAAAQKLLDAMHYDNLLDRTLDAVVVETQRSIAENLNKGFEEPIPADLLAKIQGIAEIHLRRAIGGHRAELKRGTALIYAKHFTTDELARLAVMQSDPVMARMQAEMPEITAESLALSNGIVDSAKAGLEDELKAAVLDYVKSKGKTPPPS